MGEWESGRVGREGEWVRSEEKCESGEGGRVGKE